MAPHSSILAWKIPWTENPDGLQSMGLQRVRHNWVTNTFTVLFFFLQEGAAPRADKPACHILFWQKLWDSGQDTGRCDPQREQCESLSFFCGGSPSPSPRPSWGCLHRQRVALQKQNPSLCFLNREKWEVTAFRGSQGEPAVSWTGMLAPPWQPPTADTALGSPWVKRRDSSAGNTQQAQCPRGLALLNSRM